MHFEVFHEGDVNYLPKFGDYYVHVSYGVPKQSKGSLDCGLSVC